MALSEFTKLNRKNIEALLAGASIKSLNRIEKPKTKVIAAPASTYKMPPLKDLEKRWGEFETHFGLYDATYEAVRYVGRLLTSKDFTTRISQYYNEKTSGSTEELLRVLNYKDNDYYSMDVGPKFIQTKMNFGDIKVTINPNSDPQSIMDGENILKALFPGYKTPTKWEKKTVEEQTLGNSFKIDKYSVGEDLTNTISIKKFGDIKPRFVSPNDKFKQDDMKFALPRKYFDNNFDNIASLKLTLKQSDVQPQAGAAYRLRDATEGSVSDGSFVPTMEVEVEAVYNWPVEFAYYVTCAKGPNDFIPFLFFQYLSWHKAVYSGGRTRGGGFGTRPSRINHLGNIVDRNKAEQTKGRNPKNRVNGEGFVAIGVGEASETGNVYWIPSNIDKVSAYLDQIKSAYNGEDKRVDLSRIKIKGEGLYTDWFNEKFTYLREEGVKANTADISGLQTIDLTGSVPLDNITIFKHLDEPLKTDSEGDLEWFLSIMRKFLQGDMRTKGAIPKENYSSPVYLRGLGFDIDRITDKGNMKDYLASVFYSWANRGLKFGWANIGGQPLVFQPQSSDDVLEAKNPEYFKDIRSCFNFLKVVSSDMLAQIDAIDIGYINKLSKLRYILVMITSYAANYAKFKIEHDAQVKNNEISHIPDLAYTAGLNSLVAANLPGITRLMPHQLETNIQMLPSPPASLVEVSAGGGKTIIELLEICRMLYSGEINRAIVVVPGNLVRNWVNEIQTFSKGRVNPFALNINTLRRMQYAYNQNPDPVQKPDYDMLKNIINGLPKNTIIVTSYRFLANDRERIVYGNKIIQRYYIAEFLRDIGFDMVALDESHTAKNLKSNSTTAVAILLSSAKYKRELSGTAVFDNVGDLVGQSGIMVPSALGSDSKFAKTFAESGEWDVDAPTRITDAMRPYIKRITHKRQKWAAMLPQLIESFRVVNMTPKQRQFYDSILENKIEELKKTNPKLYAKLMDGNDKDAAAISSGLATYFQAIEQFIYAPDSNEAFTQLEDLEPEDLISPKVAAVVDILNDHFNGYKDDLGREHAADTHKVIIFSHRTKTSEHMMRHLPANYQKRAVRYIAGDFQALQRFLTDKTIDILVADELSINTGQNLQLASRMIRLETLWSPGSQEQAIARIWRPAFKVGSDRQKVYMNWIYTNLSLEVTKIGRLISKILTKTKYDQQDNDFFVKDKLALPSEFKKRWSNDLPQINSNISVNDMLGSLPLLKMNIKTLTTFNTQDKLREYFAYYALMGYWEDREFDRLKSEKRYTQTVDLPPTAYKEIPNSKTIPYIPRVPGVDPTVFDPEDKMGYRPISVIENDVATANDNDSDNEDETETEINPVEITTLVDTEFGYGRVTKILQKEVWVDVAGLGEIKVPKTTAWVITNKEAENRIAKQIASGDPKSNVRLPPQVLNVIKVKPASKPVVYEPDEEDEEDLTFKPANKKHDPVDEYDEEDEEEKQLPIWASIIDTQIALNTEYNSETEFLVDEMGWKIIAPYTAIKVPTAAALEKIINKLQSIYQVNSAYIKNLDYYKTMLLNHSLDVAQPNMVNQTMRFFNVEEHKKLAATALRPFPIIWDNHFYIAFDKINTPVLRKAVNTIKLLGIPNLAVVQNEEMAVKFYASKEAALEDLRKLNKLHNNPNLAEATKVLNDVRVKKNTTVLPQKKQTSVVPKFDADVPKPKTLLKLSINAPKPQATKQVDSPKITTTTTIKQADKKPAFKLNLKGYGKQK